MVAINPLRGEAELVAGAATYTLVFDVNAFCLAEKALGLTTDEIIAAAVGDRRRKVAPRPDLEFLRAVTWAGLQRRQDLTVAEAGDVISDAGAPAARGAMLAAFAAAFGVEQEGEDRPNPPPGDAPGTGSPSSPGGARPGKA